MSTPNLLNKVPSPSKPSADSIYISIKWASSNRDSITSLVMSSKLTIRLGM